MARVLIVGGGCRGLTLARALVGGGHAVRVTTRREDARPRIEATGAECWIGDPDRLATLGAALDHVTIACWMLSCASGDRNAVAALHGTRLQFWLTRVIDTTVRGLVYEGAGTVSPDVLAHGQELVRTACTLNQIPFALLEADPCDDRAWQHDAHAAIDGLLLSSVRRADR